MAQLEATRKNINTGWSSSPVIDFKKDIFDYPLLFKDTLHLINNRTYGAFTVYNSRGEKVEENIQGPGKGIGYKILGGIYDLHIVLDGRVIRRKIIKD